MISGLIKGDVDVVQVATRLLVRECDRHISVAHWKLTHAVIDGVEL
jgi:hypothetical protein